MRALVLSLLCTGRKTREAMEWALRNDSLSTDVLEEIVFDHTPVHLR